MNPSEKEQKRISRRDFIRGAGAGAAAVAGAAALPMINAEAQAQERAASGIPQKWDLEADVVVIGSGSAGMPAAIRARDQGVSVIVVDTNYDIGGHGIICGGNVPLGGGTSAQKKYGI